MMHLLLTGGAGFIGHHLLAALYAKYPGAQITCIDNFDPFYDVAVKENNIQPFLSKPGFRLLRIDLGQTSPTQLTTLIPEKVDLILHLAAKAGVRPSIQNPEAYQQANVGGTKNLLDFAVATGVRQFIFASSSSVYGINDHYPWKEDEELIPISPYASTKLAGEQLGKQYRERHGMRFIALRFFTVYGPGQRPDLAIHKFTRAILNDQPLTVYGNGNTSRDYTYVGDIVQGILGAMKYSDSNFEIINLGNHYSISLIDLIRAIEKITGKSALLQYGPDQPGDVPKTYADISKAKRLLGYDPQTKLETGLTAFVDWFTSNR
ncbi:MAG: NAD-dependent epimerase/dehydratase family protein [Bacteroidetes bacterium]|nr:NAD-dependent epimerase/dehydratase family protein [Bacteroidota bacterium]